MLLTDKVATVELLSVLRGPSGSRVGDGASRYGPMDKARDYGSRDSGFESQYRFLFAFFCSDVAPSTVARCPPTTRVVFQAAPVFLGRRSAQTWGSAELGDDARCNTLLLRTVSLFYATKTGTDLVCEFLASSSSRVAKRIDSFGPGAEEGSFVRRGTRAFARIQCKSASLGDGDVPAWSAGTMGV